VRKDIYRKSLVSKASDVYREEGLAAVCRRAGAKLKNFFFRSNSACWFARELVSSSLTEKEQVASAPVPGSFSPVTPQELAKWVWDRRDLAWAVDPRELESASRLKHQWACWKLDGEIVAFCKVGGRRVFIVDFEKLVSLPKNLAFLSDVYVLPHARRKGIGRQLLVATMNSLRQDSFCVLSCHIPSSNQASIRLFSSLGFRSFGKIRFIRILGLPIFSMKPEVMLGKMAVAES
jgi:ribosomal protein S18 acetylase RimI-like enzyme